MKNIIRSISLVFLITIFSVGVSNAEINRDEVREKNQRTQKAADCVPATGSSQLNVNNVRAYITTAGSMWFRNSVAQYFIPKEGQASSMFAAALWIGGMDKAGQLKLAAVRFRQNGNDFWPGPLTLDAANIEQQTCILYDKIFVMTKSMAKEHMEKWDQPGYVMPDAIRNWPGNPIDGNQYQSQFIAPFWDQDGDGIYNPLNGDYPYYDFDNKLCPWTDENRALAARNELPQTMETEAGISTGGIMADQVLKGDQTLWWIFNDKGAAHTETRGFPIGLEIRAQAFGFATTDELNNMTFYSYEIINRSSEELQQTFFSQWVDPDVGWAQDDYIGCDVGRGLGYCYNGKTPDGNGLITHYGNNPPAIGVDFFQGPYLDPDGEDNPSFKGDNKYGPSFIVNYPANNGCAIVVSNGNAMEFTWDSIAKTPDGSDTMISITRYVTVRAEAINGVNFGDGIVDNERYGMRRFVYHENNNSNIIGDPRYAIEYYNFLRGIWKNNARMTFGGTGYNPGSTTFCDFMFPGDTDPCNWGTNGLPTNYSKPGYSGWTEEAESNPYGDRRFMQSAGPFTLKSGAINYITVGIPWARAVGAPWASVQLLKVVDDKAQSLFENCFKVLEGPPAPDLVFREMDGKIMCYITNAVSDDPGDNYKERYQEEDRTLPAYRIKVTEGTVDSMVYFLVCDTLTDSRGYDSLDCYYDSVKYTFAYNVTDTIWYDRWYRFEGYQIYQLADPTVQAGELLDITKAQVVFQCDIKNGVKEIKNFVYNANVGTEVPTLMVSDPSDDGIRHSFEINEDKFAVGSTDLVNYRKYYFMAIAYAYNSYAPYNTDDAEGLLGQKNPYVAGNKNVKVYTVIPHKNAMEENGTVPQAIYGTQPQIIQYEGHGNGGNALQLSKQTINEILTNGKVDSLIFEKDAGPIDVRVIDPLKVAGHDYTLRFCNADGTMADTVTDDTYWVLEYTNNNGRDTAIYSDTSIRVANEQLLLDLGISIFIKNAKFTPLDDNIRSDHPSGYKLFSSVDFITSSISYQRSEHPWYVGLPDEDGDTYNWIRAGQTKGGDWTLDNQTWQQIRSEDFYIKLTVPSTDTTILIQPDPQHTRHTIWLDQGKQFEKIVGGTFAPYALASYYDGYPAYGYELFEGPRDSVEKADDVGGNGNPARITYPCMTELYSVDIVLTADTMLWTRCPVVELHNDSMQIKDRPIRHNLRQSPSVYRNGKPDNSRTIGMGWFPGYAICIETGERLNMMFGENSFYGVYNGANMIFDPTYEFDGKHYLYVFGHQDLYKQATLSNYSVENVRDDKICPAYDEGKWLHQQFTAMEALPGVSATERRARSIEKNYIYKNIMWTGISLAHYQYAWLEKGNDVTIRIRVSRPYARWASTTGTGKGINAENNDMPLYRFSTKNIATLTSVKEVAVNRMDSIYITPNPYYGISTGGYEASQVDTRVKFINLPKSCKIKIYTLNGTLIRQFDFNSPDRDSDPNNPNSITYLEWDLKNSANIPIASGMYMIHVVDNKYGTEKTLKFLCIQRPIDVNAF